MTKPSYILTLHKSYYEKVFFNLGVAVDKFVQKTNGPITLYFGPKRRKISGRVDRNANQNGTPRIMVGAELRDLFFKHYHLGDKVTMTIESPNSLLIS